MCKKIKNQKVSKYWDRGNSYILGKHIHDRSLPWLSKGTST